MDMRKGYLSVSIIIPCYNYGSFLDEAVRSVQQSTVEIPLTRLIIVNDGSTDHDTLNILNNYKINGFNIIDQVNKGLPAARNAGISVAETDYLLPLDADDMITPTFIEKAYWVLQTRDEIGFVCSWLRHFEDETWVWKPTYSSFRLLFENVVTVTSLFRKIAWKNVGGYDEKMKEGYEDWDFWLKLIERKWQGFQIPEVLFHYRRHGRTMLHKSNKNRARIIKQLRNNHLSLFAEDNISILKKMYRINYIALKIKDFFRGLIINIPYLKSNIVWNYLYKNIATNITCDNNIIQNRDLFFAEKVEDIQIYYCKAIKDTRLKVLLLVKLTTNTDYENILKLINHFDNKYYLIVLSANIINDVCYDKISSIVDELFILPNFLNYNSYTKFLFSQFFSKEISLFVNINLLEINTVLPLIRLHKGNLFVVSVFASLNKKIYINKEILKKLFRYSDLFYWDSKNKLCIRSILCKRHSKCILSETYDHFLTELDKLIELKTSELESEKNS